ncbi:serine/threonine-protein kinase 36 isoform X2 [Trichomycterus rosablanca]|uniref:serine/threonine-protein kinase 36 isoform X2 n=1 Tax=Trichomycterus rosablanca TaxID=2290929 RepID=UPI002F356731
MEQYHVLEMIGEGSFGRVYKGRRKFSGQVVALKFIPKVGRSDKELRCLKREIEIMRGLKHPNVVLLLDSFETHTEVVVVTEYAEGELFQILEDDGSLPESQVRTIACQLVSALYYLHSHRILHRDMKPQNILLGKGGVVKLCDFGFARAMSVSTLVLTSIKGTPLYMSPELVEEKPYDHTADLWSLGCILYELHTGAPPFYTNSIFQLVQLIVKDPVRWPENMSQDCTSFLKGLLTKDPQKRLAWPGLLHHPFVADGVIVLPDEGSSSPLTVTPTPDVQALKQQQVAKKATPRSGEGKLLRKARDLQGKKHKNKQDQVENGKTLVNSKPCFKTAPAGGAPTSTRSLGSTFTVCRNSAHPAANQHHTNDIGVARVNSAPCKGPISRDYEREFPSVEVGPRQIVRRSKSGHTSLASVRMDSDDQDVNSDEEWQRLAELTDCLNDLSVPVDPSIYQKLKNKLLTTKDQLHYGVLNEHSAILQPLKILTNIIQTSETADDKREDEELNLLHILIGLIEMFLSSAHVMKKQLSEQVLGELMSVLLLIWERNPDWELNEERAKDLCQLFMSILLRPEPNLLAPLAAAVLSLFVHRGVYVNVHIDTLTAVLKVLLSEPEKSHYPLPAGWGMCDGVLALFLSVFENTSDVLLDFLNSEVCSQLWTKIGTILESSAPRADFLSVNGLSTILSVALFAFSKEPYDCVPYLFDNKTFTSTLIHLLSTDSSLADSKRGLLWGGSDMNSLSEMSCHLLCFPFTLELPQEKMAVILDSYQKLNIVAELVQVIQIQPLAFLELPLLLLCHLCLSCPEYTVPSFITAAQAYGFLPQSTEPSQNLNLNHLTQSGSTAEQPKRNGIPHKGRLDLARGDEDQPQRTIHTIKGSVKCLATRDPSKVQSLLTKSKSGKLKERDQSNIKQNPRMLSMEHLQDSIEQRMNVMEEPLDSLELQNGFSDHLKHLTQHKREMSWLIDSLEQPKDGMCSNTGNKDSHRASLVNGQLQAKVRTASSLLFKLLQSESLCGCAVQLLTLLFQTCHSRYTPDSTCFGLPVDPAVLRMALCHRDDGVRAAGCNLLTCVEPYLEQDYIRQKAHPIWTIEPALFTDLISLLSDSAPSVRRSACKAVERWLGIIEKQFRSKASKQDLQKEPGKRRTMSAPAVTSTGQRVRRVEGIKHGLKEAPGLPLSSKEEENWLNVAMGAATPAVSLLSDSDAVIRRHGCVLLGNLAAIAGGEKMLICEDASNQLLRMARTDSHHAVRRQAVATLCTFSQQDALQQALKSIDAGLKLHHMSQCSPLQSNHRWMGQAKPKHNNSRADSTPG